MVSNFYNIKTEVGVSIVDGPFTSATVRNWPAVVVFSVAIGFLASLLLNVFLDSLGGAVKPKKSFSAPVPPLDLGKKFGSTEKKKEDFMKEEVAYDAPYDFQEIAKKSLPQENMEQEEIETTPLDNEAYPNFPEMPRTAPKSAQAPANLPIADGFEQFEEFPEEEFRPEQEKGEQVQEEPSFVEMKKEEPTDEELKERLNKLLRGDM